jgi:hypothetical protein
MQSLGAMLNEYGKREGKPEGPSRTGSDAWDDLMRISLFPILYRAQQIIRP